MRKLLIFILLLIPVWLNATNYYVKNSGNNANTGLSNAQAWQTIAKVNTIAFAAGDTILFNRGDTWIITTGTEALNIHHSGTDGHQITFGAYGTGNKPILTGRTTLAGWNTTGNWTDGGSNIWHITVDGDAFKAVRNTRGRLWVNGVELMHSNSTTVPTALLPWTHNGFTLYVYSTSNPATAFSSMEVPTVGANLGTNIYIIDTDYITVQNLDLRGCYNNIYMSNANNCIIENCNIGLDVSAMGIYAVGGGTPAVCDNNIVRNNTFDTDDHNMDGWLCQNTEDAIFLIDGAHNWDIYGNTFIDWSHAALEEYNPTAGTTITNISFYGNYVTAPDNDYGRFLAITVIGSNQNLKIYSNYIFNTSIRSQINADGAMVYDNVIDLITRPSYLAAGGEGISLEGTAGAACKNIQILNNTIVNCDDEGIWIAYWASNDIQGNTIANNIIANCNIVDNYQIEIDDDANILNNTWKNNLLYKAGVTDLVYYGHSATNDYPHTIAEFNAENGTASDVISGNITGDPLFLSSTDFHLQSGSPAKDAGIDVGLTIDYDGYLVPQGVGYDIGALEYGAVLPKLLRDVNGKPMRDVNGKLMRQG